MRLFLHCRIGSLETKTKIEPLAQTRSLPHRQLRNILFQTSERTTRSLPYRQLRNNTAIDSSKLARSLPHRQLRKYVKLAVVFGSRSLPHRLLRNQATTLMSISDDFECMGEQFICYSVIHLKGCWLLF